MKQAAMDIADAIHNLQIVLLKNGFQSLQGIVVTPQTYIGIAALVKSGTPIEIDYRYRPKGERVDMTILGVKVIEAPF